MQPVVIAEIEGTRDIPAVYRSLARLRDGLNGIPRAVRSGRVLLVAGVAKVPYPGLSSGTVIVVGYTQPKGTPGTLRVDTIDYDLSSDTFTIRSSSATDGSLVAWVAVA